MLLPTYSIADDTFVISSVATLPTLGQLVTSLYVIRGAEPILVDTGDPVDEKDLLEAIEKVVPLEELRWVFLSHEDHHHAGNIGAVLKRAPNAKVLASFLGFGRTNAYVSPIPLSRARLCTSGERI